MPIDNWRQNLYDRLIEIWLSCNVADWDCYDAEPVSSEAIDGARALLWFLPEDCEHPEVCPEADGRVAFEWDLGKDMLLSVSVLGHELVYAGIMDDLRTSGTVTFSDHLPNELWDLLVRYFSKKTEVPGR